MRSASIVTTTFWIGPAGQGPLKVMRPTVVVDGLPGILAPDDVGLAEGHLGLDADVGQAVLEERHVVEDVLDRVRPVDVDP